MPSRPRRGTEAGHGQVGGERQGTKKKRAHSNECDEADDIIEEPAPTKTQKKGGKTKTKAAKEPKTKLMQKLQELAKAKKAKDVEEDGAAEEQEEEQEDDDDEEVEDCT